MIAITGPGGLTVPVYSLLLGVSAALGLAWSAWQAPVEQALGLVNAGIWAGVGALVGARIAYVAIAWSYFQNQPSAAAQVFMGGLSWPGALLGGILALAIHARLARKSLGLLAAGLLPFAALLASGAWMGCWLQGCAYGAVSTAWWALPAVDEWGLVSRRVPVQLLASLLALGLLWFLQMVAIRAGIKSRLRQPLVARPAGIAWLGLLGLSLLLLGAAFLRADPAPAAWGLRLEIWAALGFAICAALGTVAHYLIAKEAFP